MNLAEQELQTFCQSTFDKIPYTIDRQSAEFKQVKELIKTHARWDVFWAYPLPWYHFGWKTAVR